VNELRGSACNFKKGCLRVREVELACQSLSFDLEFAEEMDS